MMGSNFQSLGNIEDFKPLLKKIAENWKRCICNVIIKWHKYPKLLIKKYFI